MTYWQLFTLGAICLILGIMGIWRAPKFSGWRTLANCLCQVGGVTVMMAAYFQFQHLFR